MLQRIIPHAEFLEHVAYWQMFRWGEDWLQTGVQAAAAANSNPHRRHSARVEQFMPKVHKPVQTPQEQANILMGFINRMKAAGKVTEV